MDHEDHGNLSLLRFGALWQAEYNHDSLLVYSTGRSPTMYFDLRQEVPLLTPGIAILSVGTEIMYGDTMTPDLGWVKELSKGWNRAAVEEVAKEMNLKYQVYILMFITLIKFCTLFVDPNSSMSLGWIDGLVSYSVHFCHNSAV